MEVLATLTLAAIILPVAMRGVSLATAAAGQARRQLEGASLAEAKLADLIATGDWQSSELSGEFEEDRPGYRWSAEVQSWEGTALQEVAVTVMWTAAGKQRSVTLTTLVYGGSS